MSIPAVSQPRTRSTAASEQELLERVANELKWKIAGEVRFDETARALYATDASPYEIKPLGVVLPKSSADVRRTLDVARHYGLPVLPRGGGTSLAGQTVGAAIVLDFSKYMNRILDLDPKARRVRVEPGVIRDNLNLALAPHGLQFTPDVATTSRANVGGMVGNNSAGTRSIKYGKTVDQVEAMSVMLADGSVCDLRELSPQELAAKLEQPGREGGIYRTVKSIIDDHEDEILARYPKVLRRVGGYNLDEFTAGRPFNLAKLVCGSEGTLATILDVTLKLEPVPAYRCLVLLHFDELGKALSAVQHVNRHRPSAVEILDDNLFDLGKQNPNLRPLLGWLQGEPAAVLMVEFDGDTEAEMMAGVRSLQADPQVAALSYCNHLALSPDDQQAVWEFRKGGLGIFATIKGDAKPIGFIEDAAIPVEHLPSYIPEVMAVCTRHQVKTVLYAHASVGVIHIKPILDLKTEEGIRKYEAISLETFELVKKYGGSWSGEHGDGLVRSYQNENLFGKTLYQDFRRLKHAFDPGNMMNPGKIVDAPPMTENLRFGTDYRPDAVQTYFDFGKDGGFLGAVEMCSGVGHCRKTTTGTMCPSYMATLDEDHSTRGRANMLRQALSGRLPGGLTSREVYGVLDLCLECKGCKAECPSQVDMAKLKYEFLQHYYDEHGTPVSALAFGHVARTSPLGHALAPVANQLLPLPPVRWLLEKTLGVDRRRVMPRYAAVSFAEHHRKRAAAPTASAEGPLVALFADTWTMYHDPHIGSAATRVLDALGYRVELVPYGCCGRPQISKGLLRSAKRTARGNVKKLYEYVRRGVPVVGLEPSCVVAFQDDYRDLVPGEMTEAVAKNVKMVDQFLAKEWTTGRLEPTKIFRQTEENLLFHGHCQQKAIIGSSASTAVLSWVAKDVRALDAGCCGMAGSFGYSHYDVSMKVGEGRLFPAVRAHPEAVVSCGFSCRHQIADGTGKRAKHVVEVLADAL